MATMVSYSARRKNVGTYRILLTAIFGFLSLLVTILSWHNVTIVHSFVQNDDPYHSMNVPSRRLLPLQQLTHSSPINCPDDLVPIHDHHHKESPTISKIPRVIHQTSKSRCLVPSLADTVQKWKAYLPDFDYYFHDDAAMETLLRMPSLQASFPLLEEISLHCTRGAMRADLWRYVVLWEYGGIYSDIDTYPLNLTLSPVVDAYFVLEQDGLLSQYFMAVAPKHPLMFYTIQHTLANVLKSKDPFKDFAPTLTGPRALHQGFQTFYGNEDSIPDSTGQWLGMNHPLEKGGVFVSNGYSVVVDGTLEHPNDIIMRDAIPREEKKKLFSKMNMTYFMQDARTAPRGESCMQMVHKALQQKRKL